jgi:drug/metabolite transporter (DMT)-like permease
MTRFLGPLCMTLATGSYVVNDTMMKIVTEALPPYETLFLRGIAATAWGLPLLLVLGHRRNLPLMFDPRVVARNLCELAAILCYVVALANMLIADVVALGQITPLLVLLGSALLLGERIGGLRLSLIALGFAGALMVAQPTGAGLSVFALLALGNAVFSAMRDLASRQVGPEVPGLVVALSASVIVLAGAGIAHLLLEDWVPPAPRHLALMAGSGLFLFFGHFLIFKAYRIGPTRAVAPFFYAFTLWAVLSGALVFGQLPNPLALAGIALVTASGLVIVWLDARPRRPVPVA